MNLDLSTLNFEELKTLADSLEGFKYPGNIKEDTLRKNMDQFILDNPSCLDETGSESDENATSEAEKLEAEKLEAEKLEAEKLEAEKIVPEAKKPETKEQGMVKMKSNTPGVKNTSKGSIEFDAECFATVTEEQAVHLENISGYSRC